MGRHYDDALEFLLDGEAESVSNGRCTGLTPSPQLQAQYETWKERVTAALVFWGRGHGKEAGIAAVIEQEAHYEYDVYQTLAGAGVGMDDGRWDDYLEIPKQPGVFRSAQAGTRVLKNLRMHLEKWLKRDFAVIATAVQDEAMEQCPSEEDEDLGSADPEHISRFYTAFSALEDIAKSRAERRSCKARYDALLRVRTIVGALRAEYRAIEKDASSENRDREAPLMQQATDWMYALSVEFDQRCAKRFSSSSRRR
jgi:hypothetical protein